MFYNIEGRCVVSTLLPMEAVFPNRMEQAENFLAQLIRAFACALTPKVRVVQSLVDGTPDGIGRVNRPADIQDTIQPLASGVDRQLVAMKAREPVHKKAHAPVENQFFL